jgi:hypothetical protein
VLLAPLPGLYRDRRRTGNALQTLGVDKALTIVADLGEQPWRQFLCPHLAAIRTSRDLDGSTSARENDHRGFWRSLW